MYVLENLIPAGFSLVGIPRESRSFFIKTMFQRVIKHRYQASQDFFNGKHFKNHLRESLASYLDYLKLFVMAKI
jgi:hypothetical protein